MYADVIREARKGQDYSEELAQKGWYHSFELPDGTLIDGVNSLARLRDRWSYFPIPADLRGKRVLDIGAWDGWFSLEAERRGADVTSIDYVEVAHFVELQRKFLSRIDYRIMEVYELADAGLGNFDYILFLGVLYHLRHPLLALEIVCSKTTDIAIIESFVTDGDTWKEHTDDIPALEFYEGCELAGQFDNWSGPSVACLLAMCRSAGFARVELLRAELNNALVACYRKWDPPPAEPAAEAPQLISAVNSRGQGVNFWSRKEQYVTCWFRSPRQTIGVQELMLEVDGLGAAAHFCKRCDDLTWMANFGLPPGLKSGWRHLRLRFGDSGFSNTVRIAVDLPLHVERIACTGVRDGVTWNADEVRAAETGFLTCWTEGLPENADRHNVRVYLGKTKLGIDWFGEPDANGCAQINATVAPDFPRGEYALRLECGGVSSEPRTVRVV